MAAPTFIQEAETVWNTTTSPKTTASFAVLAGDILVVGAIQSHSEGTSTFTCSGGSLTWTLRQEVDVFNYCWAGLWTAQVDSDKSMTVTVTRTAGPTTDLYGFNTYCFRGSDGVGASAATNVSSGAPTLNLTTTQAASALVVINGDWNGADGASRTWRTNAGTLTEQTYYRDGTFGVTFYGGYHADAGAIGTYAVGLSAPGSQKYSIAAVEIKGTASGASAVPRYMRSYRQRRGH